jgi:hypothetical protein
MGMGAAFTILMLALANTIKPVKTIFKNLNFI